MLNCNNFSEIQTMDLSVTKAKYFKVQVVDALFHFANSVVLMAVRAFRSTDARMVSFMQISLDFTSLM